ncbi:MAG: MFS transporter [Bacteroidales bacterium]|nr:MFS transporter [Bacteroidales bacterium]
MRKNPTLWIPTLYLAEGIPYTIVNVLSVIFLKLKGLDNTDIALYTGWLYLPWLIKPLWSPIVEMLGRSRFWITATQIIMGAAMASLGLTIPMEDWLRYCMLALWLTAFMSATHDIAADGFYIEALSQKQQATWVGIRSTFYKIAMLLCQGALVVVAGKLQDRYGIDSAWEAVFFILAAILGIFGIYHLWALPNTHQDNPEQDFTGEKNDGSTNKNLKTQIESFFQKDGILLALAFMLLYRLGESQLAKMAAPFMLDSIENGGLGLSTETLGYINGTFGLVAMSVGGIVGGLAIARHGLKRWLIPMILAINVPDALYALMAYTQIQDFAAIASMVSLEQFGYGFGFAAYSVYMLQFSKGQYPTSHYSICTAFMAAGMMLPGMCSGWIESHTGYPMFFVWVMICCVPSVLVAIKIKNRLND